jgi:hypothetical protein
MKYVALALFVSVGYLYAEPPSRRPAAPVDALLRETPNGGIHNPAIDMDGYLKVAGEAAAHRAKRRITEDEFIAMSKEKGTIILDARSKEMYDLMHVEGAINLSFSNIDIESLKKTLPDKDARILIYCNNNFTDPNKPPEVDLKSIAFARKMPTASLNISTYIALYNHGYRNVYELGPLVDPEKSKLKFAVKVCW